MFNSLGAGFGGGTRRREDGKGGSAQKPQSDHRITSRNAEAYILPAGTGAKSNRVFAGRYARPRNRNLRRQRTPVAFIRGFRDNRSDGHRQPDEPGLVVLACLILRNRLGARTNDTS